MWTFDYRTFWNPGVDTTIKVWYGDVIVGELHSEPAARELQSRLQGAFLGSGEGNPPPASVPLPAWPPADEAAAPAPSLGDVPDPAAVPTPAPPVDPPPILPDTPELLRITCAGPLHNAICRVLGYRENKFLVRVVSEGPYCGEETTVGPDHSVPHVAGNA